MQIFTWDKTLSERQCSKKKKAGIRLGPISWNLIEKRSQTYDNILIFSVPSECFHLKFVPLNED